MTDEEAIKQAVEKAWKNGYQGCKRVTQWHYLTQKGRYEGVIFNHDFALAFFGEYWQPRLQILVLEEKPIQYMAKFL